MSKIKSLLLLVSAVSIGVSSLNFSAPALAYDLPASQSKTDTNNFDGALSTADTDVQKALETLDGLTTPEGAAPLTANFIVQTPDAGLSSEQAMSALATGIVKNTTTTGVQSIAVAGTDYLAPAGSGAALTGITKSQVGLGSADNTADTAKPVSTAQQTAIDLKVTKNANITAATKTKVTYDVKGLVTAGADATTADIADSSDKRYITDAQQTALGTLSGTNTGDQSESSIEALVDLQDLQGAVTDAQVPNNITITGLSGTNTGDQTTISGNAGTATALAANGANCAAGEYPLGVNASGVTENCTDVTTEIDAAVTTHTSDVTLVHGLNIVNTPAAGDLLIRNSGNSAFEDMPISGDATITSGGVVTVANDSHTHGTSTLDTDSVSATQLNVAGVESELEAALDLTDLQGAVTDAQVPNNISVDLATSSSDLTCTDCIGPTEISDAYLLNNGDAATGTYDFSGTLLEVANGTVLTGTDCDAAGEAGRIFVDTDATTGQQFYVCEGAAGWTLSSGAGGGGGDVTSAGDCAGGACGDGTSDGGTYYRIYDGDSHYGELKTSNLSANRAYTFPNFDGTMATLAGTETLTGKTLSAASNIINADDAVQLTSNGANCSAGSAPLGVDPLGAAETCTDYEEDLSNSAGLRGALSDETGTGNAVFSISPSFTTPILGVAAATTLDTGQGANELYPMNQNVRTSDSPTFAALTLAAPLPLASGGLGIGLVDPAEDRIPFWDDSLGTYAWLDYQGPLTITDVGGVQTLGLSILGFGEGGTGQTSRQAAINSLTNVSAGSTNYVLTKDGSGNATFLANPASLLTDSTTNLSMTTTTDDFMLGAAAPVNSAKFSIDGDADQVQQAIKAHTTQTTNLSEWVDSGGATMVAVQPDGTIAGTGSTPALLQMGQIQVYTSQDDYFSGDVISATAGESVTLGSVCYMKSDGKLWKADSDALATMPAVAISTATIAADATGIFGVRGFLRDDSAYAWTVGGRVYVSATAGTLTQTAPTGADDVIQKVGIGWSADILYFQGGLTEVEDSTT